MLIQPHERSIILRTSRVQQVLKTIPTSQPVAFGDGSYVKVPHTVDEIRVLQNLGFDAPSPILHYYDWPRAAYIPAPFAAQKTTAAFLTMTRRGYCHNDLGTGKSLSALWAYDYLRSEGQLDKMLVVAPLSTLEPTWAESIEEHLPHLTYRVLHGSRKRRLMLLEEPVDIYIINFDGVVVLQDELEMRQDIDLVVVDEVAQAARNQRTARWKALNTVCNSKRHKRAVWGMTGTPIPNAPTDAFAQAKLITPETAPGTFTRYRERVMRQLSQFKWVPREGYLQTVQDTLSPAIRFRRDECVDLPPTTYVDRDVTLTQTQAQAYKAMMDTCVIEAQSGRVLAVNEGVKMSKLLQVACGVAYDTEGKEVGFDPGPRLDELLNCIEESASKTLVFAPFTAAVRAITEYLRSNGITAEMIYGDVSKADRDLRISLFQNTTDPRVLVCQPAAMSHGLTLTAASTTVWYAPTLSAETYEQANGRTTRPGQVHNTLIIHLRGTEVERRIYNRLKNKQKVQGSLLSLIEQQGGRKAA